MLTRYAISPRSIVMAVKDIKGICDLVFEFQEDYVQGRFERIEKLTRARTMVATGELRSKLFMKIARHSRGSTRFVCGYSPTSNNQAYHQEFDATDNVHTSRREHFDDRGNAKCSRVPVDLYSRYGQTYLSNRSARRRALATSIEEALNTRVNFGTDGGGNIRYEPDLSNLILKLSQLTSGVCRAY